ncbi:TlpA disulfide reductase family protein [Chitinophaga sp.]|uniref:TlpA family protein disulfide reductase n=1 Tax=Chitinophaga sp. TaxID=1869181 RepID=UPI0031DD3093
MRSIRLLFLLLLPVYTLSAQPATVVKTVFRESPGKIFIVAYDPVTGEAVEHKAKKQGNAMVISFTQLMPGEVFFHYGKKWTALLLVPGDTLEVAANGDSLRFAGARARANEQLQAYRLQLFGPDVYDRGRELNRYIPDSSAAPVKTFLQSRFVRDSAVLAAFIRVEQPDTLLRQWAWQSLRYEVGDQLLRYASFKDYKVPGNWFDAVEPLAARPENILSISRSSFVDEYSNYQLWKVINHGRNFVTYCESLPAGIMRDMMLTRYVYALKEALMGLVLKPDVARIKRMLTHPVFSGYVRQAYKDAADNEGRGASLAEAKRMETPGMTADSVLQKFIAPYAGKAVYVDVWATWCVPCREEMPASQQLRQRLEKDSVVFVYLCVGSPEKTWKSVVSKMDIRGEHFLLTQAEYDALRETYRLQGVPHYLVADREGKVVHQNAPGPSDERVEEILRKLAD